MSRLAKKSWILPVIVISQFACTSLWFAGNAVTNDIINAYSLDNSVVGHIISSVQFGFISGTLIFAIFNVSDRFSPSKVFFTSAILGAGANVGIFIGDNLLIVLLSRFITGFLLAGIYPVGMKIAADHHKEGLGKALGYLVGALVVGTAFPHLLKGFSGSFAWQTVIVATSICAAIGGLLILLFVPDGPYRRKSQKPDFTTFFKVFQKRDFRSAAFGYFGHMWELYAFWAFIPTLIIAYNNHRETALNVSFYTFGFIAIGGLACVLGGYIAMKKGSDKTAFSALLISGACCILSPFIINLSPLFFVSILTIWGMAVITDSPQFSTLVAHSAPAESKGTALTIVNSVGFFISIFSIQLLNWLVLNWEIKYIFLPLIAGPLFGLISMLSLRGK